MWAISETNKPDVVVGLVGCLHLAQTTPATTLKPQHAASPGAFTAGIAYILWLVWVVEHVRQRAVLAADTLCGRVFNASEPHTDRNPERKHRNTHSHICLYVIASLVVCCLNADHITEPEHEDCCLTMPHHHPLLELNTHLEAHTLIYTSHV